MYVCERDTPCSEQGSKTILIFATGLGRAQRMQIFKDRKAGRVIVCRKESIIPVE